MTEKKAESNEEKVEKQTTENSDELRDSDLDKAAGGFGTYSVASRSRRI